MTENKSKNSNKIIVLLIILVVLIIGIICFLVKSDVISLKKPSTDNTTVSDTVNNTSDNNETEENDSTNPSKNDDEKESDEPENTSNKISAELPLSINDVFSILQEKYGDGFVINASTSGEGYQNFAVFEGENRYATVTVYLDTGEATELVTATGEITNFSLL